MKSFDNLIITKEYSDKIWIITINRVKFANAVDPKTAEELAKAFIEFDEDKTSCVAILTGKGSHFCGGFDLKAFAKENNFTDSYFSKNNKKKLFDKNQNGPLGISRMTLSKPVIAAVNGFAAAGGFELMIWCDMRVSFKDCGMGILCRRFGVPLIDGGTVRLPLLIGLSRAMDLILTGRTITGKEAFDIGLVNRLVDKQDDVLEETMKIAKDLCDLPQTCMRNDRMSTLTNSYNNQIMNLMGIEYSYGIKTLMSNEGFEGAKLFSKGVGKHGKKVENKPKF